MILEGDNAWSNFSYGSRIDTPNGCLLNPEGSRLIFFERRKKLPQNCIKIFTHTFYTNHLGEPAGFKSTKKIQQKSLGKNGMTYKKLAGQKYHTILVSQDKS